MSTDRDYTQYVMKAKQGDRSALNDLADRVDPHLLEYVMRMTMDTHLAQDLVQESLLTMVQEYDRLRDPRQFWFTVPRHHPRKRMIQGYIKDLWIIRFRG